MSNGNNCGCGSGTGEDNIPVDSQCIPDTTDPCANPDISTQPCPNVWCDDRLLDLPQSKFVRLIGTVGRCFHTLFKNSEGFVVSTPQGEQVTNRPCVKIPFLKSYLTDPETGQFLVDADGDLIQGAIPPFDSLIVGENECGCINRVQGLPNQLQELVWNGNRFEFQNKTDCPEGNAVLEKSRYPYTDAENVKNAVLIPVTETVCVDGMPQTVCGYRIGWNTPAVIPPSSGSAGLYVIVEDRKPEGTDGGTFTAGAWRVRDVNTIANDDTGLVSIAGNRVTLPAGKYYADVRAPAYNVKGHRLRLYNFTDSSQIGDVGQTHFSDVSSANQFAKLVSVFTLDDVKEIEIQHWCQRTIITDGLGHDSELPLGDEIYTQATFVRIGEA